MVTQWLKWIPFSVVIAACGSEAKDKAPHANDVPKDSWAVESIRDVTDTTQVGEATTVLHFKNGNEIRFPLRDVKFVGLIQTAQAPWAIVSGYGCSDCDVERQLYVVRADQPSTVIDRTGYTFPGEQSEAGVDETPFSKSKTFWGDCIVGKPNSIVWLTEEKDSAGVWVKNAFLLELTEVAKNSRPSWTDSLQKEITRATSTGRCHEIPGTDQSIL